MKILLRYLNTIRFLKFKQIYSRIWFFISKPRIKKSRDFELRKKSDNFYSIPKVNSYDQDNQEFNFLNIKNKYDVSLWNDNNQSRLWMYNLHYFDYINSSNARTEISRSLIHDWIDNNPVGKGPGWEPYPISLRIVNWIKWLVANECFDEKINYSLMLQSRFLSKRIEHHIQANHLIANYKALYFSGSYFQGQDADNFLKKGTNGIFTEIDNQILHDGMHFELSPMYHLIILEDLLDLISISKIFINDLEEPLNKICAKMFNVCDVFMHPDGEIAFFNDSAFSIANSFDSLMNLASKLGVKINHSIKASNLMNSSGYSKLSLNDKILIIDLAQIEANFQPGHSHADTLSFEFSHQGKRVFVNSGISTYDLSELRKFQRSTAAHNTLTINNENSSDVWSAFRVGKRAKVSKKTFKEVDNYLSASGQHDGYSYMPGKPIHSRSWELAPNSLQITDSVFSSNKNHKKIIIRYFLHPDFSAVVKNNQEGIIEGEK